MKRKRGNKKGKPKKSGSDDFDNTEIEPVMANLNVVSANTEEKSGSDDFDNTEIEPLMAVNNAPSLTGTDQIEKPANPKPERMVQAVYGRVKVKLKTPKILDSQPVSSLEASMQIDNDKSNQQMVLEKNNVTSLEKMEDKASVLHEVKVDDSGSLLKKNGNTKIKSPSGFVSSNINLISSGLVKIPHQKTKYNKQELDDALTVIKKVMKMDAAEPFNVPVNPIAMGIPDYFDVIKTPMDFGSICSNLEKGVQYMNSEDVYKDVEYIWENCYKYNNKGDYIVDLMKRVKKNFVKYWTATGLYTDQSQQVDETEKNQAEDGSEGSQMKQKKGKKHGFKKHKDGCLCAICILMRRRREREESALGIEHQTGTNLELKQEVSSLIESPGENTSSNTDPESEADDIDNRGEEMKPESTTHHDNSLHQEKKTYEMDLQMKETMELGDRSSEDPCRPSQTQMLEDLSSCGVQTDNEKDETPVLDMEETKAAQHSKESQERHKKAKLLENLSRYENPLILRLCETLFLDDHRSIWSGQHSLVRQGSSSSSRRSSIHAAIETFMK